MYQFFGGEISKSAYQNDFWRSRDPEDSRNNAKNLALHHKNKLHFKMWK